VGIADQKIGGRCPLDKNGEEIVELNLEGLNDESIDMAADGFVHGGGVSEQLGHA
jgi:hypothetical protein